MKKVSVVVPCFNEENTILLLLNALKEQSYPLDHIEILIADGLSTDGSRDQIAKFKKKFPALQTTILDNHSRVIPSALNIAIKQARGDIILRLDAHCVPNRDYIQRSVDDIKEKKGWLVGGVWDIRPRNSSWIAEAIAVAAAHPIGVGDARYRYSGKAQEVETVPFGAFERSLIARIGPFDESLKANEDYEFNARIRKAGGRIWLNPKIRSTYFARPCLNALAKQYARYGYWKWRMLKRYPESLRWRQALPPLFVLGLLLGPVLSIWWPGLLILWKAAVVSYGLLIVLFGVIKALQMSKPSLVLGLPLAISVMHLSYGSSMIWSMLHSGFKKA